MIWIEESKKIIKHPVMWCLMAVFICINTFLLWSYIGVTKAEMRELHKDVVQDTIPEVLTVKNKNLYDNLDMMEILKIEQELTGYEPKGEFRDFVDRQYAKLNERVKEIKSNGEAEDLFYPGYYYRLHTILFSKLLRYTVIEMMILICLSTLFLMDYERINKTGDIVYASQIGRTIQMKKLLLGNGIGLLFGIGLMVVTLVIYFSQVSYEGLWNVSISSAMMAVPRGVLLYPLITFREMSFLQYLMATCLVEVVLVAIIGVLAGGMQLLFRNSYYSFMTMVLIFLGCLAAAGITTGTWWDILLSINPSAMIHRTGGWFMENEIQLCFEGNEVLSLAMQSVVVMVLVVIGKKQWMKGDC